MVRKMDSRFGKSNSTGSGNFRRTNPPLCPEHGIPCRCERTKTDGEFKIQYRYCPVCGHPEQTVTRIDGENFELGSN